MTAPTAANAAETTIWVGLALWGLALVIYLARSVRATRRGTSPADLWPRLPTTTMTVIGVAEFAANLTIMVVEPVGRIPAIWWSEHLLPTVFWLAMTNLVIVFGWQSRRRLLMLSTRLSRYEYAMALEERRRRAHAARFADLVERLNAPRPGVAG